MASVSIQPLQLQKLGDELDARAAAISDAVEYWQQQVAQLATQWSGDAAEAYVYAVQQHVHRQIQLITELRAIAEAARTTADQYSALDLAGQQRLGA